MRKIFIVIIIFVLSGVLWAGMQDYNWALNYAQYKEGAPWHITSGNWKTFKVIHFDDSGLVCNRKNQAIGVYWFSHPTLLIVKIDTGNLTFYGSFRFLENSVIMCGTGEIYQNRKLTIVKIIMARTIKHKK